MAYSAEPWREPLHRQEQRLAALDLNEEAVKKLADECKAEGYICEGYKANVLEHEALEEHPAVNRVVVGSSPTRGAAQ